VGETLVAVTLEPDHQATVRPVDGRRDDAELRDLGGVPDRALRVAVNNWRPWRARDDVRGILGCTASVRSVGKGAAPDAETGAVLVSPDGEYAAPHPRIFCFRHRAARTISPSPCRE